MIPQTPGWYSSGTLELHPPIPPSVYQLSPYGPRRSPAWSTIPIAGMGDAGLAFVGGLALLIGVLGLSLWVQSGEPPDLSNWGRNPHEFDNMAFVPEGDGVFTAYRVPGSKYFATIYEDIDSDSCTYKTKFFNGKTGCRQFLASAKKAASNYAKYLER